MSFSLPALHAEFEQLVALAPLPPPPAPPTPVPAAPSSVSAEAPASTPAAPSVPPPQPPPPQVRQTDFAARGFNFDARIQPDQVVRAAAIMDRHGFALDAVSGVDWLATGEMEVVYDYFHPSAPCRAVVRARVQRAQPALPTISGVFAGANWHERETAEFFGIQFIGHPNLIPLLLPEDSTFHPLRKDYAP